MIKDIFYVLKSNALMHYYSFKMWRIGLPFLTDLMVDQIILTNITLYSFSV